MLAVVGVLGVIVYRMSIFAVPSFKHIAGSSPDPILFSSVSAALINLLCVTILNQVSLSVWVMEKLLEMSWK